MTVIKTIDGNMSFVEEDRFKIGHRMRSSEVKETGVIQLHHRVIKPGDKKWGEETTYIYEPASFVVRNIIMYY